MARIAQLSDLHFLGDPEEQAPIFDALVAALDAERAARGGFDMLAITGDVFDDAAVSPRDAARSYARLHARLDEALGGEVPTVIVPGNHDRRRKGLFAPLRSALFHELGLALGDHVYVHGCATPYLATVVAPEHHRLPLWVVAYDSTYLPRGLLSAGGMMRQEDLLYAASRIGDRHPDWPVLFLLHHHLVPTPLTDLGPVPVERTTGPVRWALGEALPYLVAHADREELTMTALGAGTAISTLHTLGRAVLVLHGHKHYATARLLDATIAGHGDVLIASAGSAGTAEQWTLAASSTARLWPSFNVVEWEADRVTIDSIGFGYKGRSLGVTEPRPLARARRDGAQWRQEPIDPAELVGGGRRLALNRAHFAIRRGGGGRADYRCEREVRLSPDPAAPPRSRLGRYVETVTGAPEATLTPDGYDAPEPLPTEVTLALDGVVSFHVRGGLYDRLDPVHHQHADRHAPFASVSRMNRYGARDALLEAEGIDATDAFASATDLGTGLERPIPLHRHAEGAVVRVRDCPPRTLLRLYWPLDPHLAHGRGHPHRRASPRPATESPADGLAGVTLLDA